MTHKTWFSPGRTFLITAVLVPFLLISAAGAFVMNLGGLNPENQNKVLVHPISSSDAYTVQKIFVYGVAPFAIIVGLLAASNLKFRNMRLNQALIIACVVFIGWLLFAMWALSGKYESIPQSYDPGPVQTSNSTDHNSLQIRTYDLH